MAVRTVVATVLSGEVVVEFVITVSATTGASVLVLNSAGSSNAVVVVVSKDVVVTSGN